MAVRRLLVSVVLRLVALAAARAIALALRRGLVALAALVAVGVIALAPTHSRAGRRVVALAATEAFGGGVADPPRCWRSLFASEARLFDSRRFGGSHSRRRCCGDSDSLRLLSRRWSCLESFSSVLRSESPRLRWRLDVEPLWVQLRPRSWRGLCLAAPPAVIGVRRSLAELPAPPVVGGGGRWRRRRLRWRRDDCDCAPAGQSCQSCHACAPAHHACGDRNCRARVDSNRAVRVTGGIRWSGCDCCGGGGGGGCCAAHGVCLRTPGWSCAPAGESRQATTRRLSSLLLIE